MSHDARPDDDESGKERPGRRIPRPVRPQPAETGSGAGRPKPVGGDSGGGRPKPTPVRAVAEPEAPPPPVEPDVEEAELTVDGQMWTVRVTGRAGGPHPAAAPLLLLGFWSEDSTSDEPEREALVVGRTLEGLSPSDLRTAFDGSRPPPPPPERRDEGPGRRKGSRRNRGRNRRR